MAAKVAVVSGANKGIGFGIVRDLCKSFNGDVILTARDVGRGQAAVAELEKEGLYPKFHQLDITDHASIKTLRDFLNDKYQGLDVLVNNAAICFIMTPSSDTYRDEADETLKTNYFQTLDVCNVLFPILKPHARVVNLSSTYSLWSLAKSSEALRERFTSSDITMDELSDHMNKFLQSANKKESRKRGPSESTAYGMSKVGVTVMSRIQQRDMDQRGADDIVVNACCPGFVDTDMTNHQGTKSISEGAETPVYLALLPPNVTQPRGEFLIEKEITPWTI